MLSLSPGVERYHRYQVIKGEMKSFQRPKAEPGMPRHLNATGGKLSTGVWEHVSADIFLNKPFYAFFFFSCTRESEGHEAAPQVLELLVYFAH